MSSDLKKAARDDHEFLFDEVDDDNIVNVPEKDNVLEVAR
jgi:hypothetical protein